MSRRKRKKDRLKDRAMDQVSRETRADEETTAERVDLTEDVAARDDDRTREPMVEEENRAEDDEKALALALEQRVMRPTDDHVTYHDEHESTRDEANEGSAGEPEPEPTEDRSEGRVGKRELIIILVALLAIALFLVFSEWRSAHTDSGASALGPVTALTFTNDTHDYSFSYPSDFQLIAEGSIPREMSDTLGITSMADLNLSDSDALLIENRADFNENIVYTVLNLSRNPNFISRIAYEDALLAEIEALTDGEDAYSVEAVVVGPDEIPGTQVSFSTQVEVAPDEFRTGRFFDTIFEHGGDTYSVSFGYPVDALDADRYITSYRDLLASFEFHDEATR